jgi:hypothetical protein
MYLDSRQVERSVNPGHAQDPDAHIIAFSFTSLARAGVCHESGDPTSSVNVPWKMRLCVELKRA